MFIPEKLYKEIVENTIIQTVDIVFINDKNQILLWLRKNEPLKWIYYLPWWRRFKNEKILDSVKRKVKEELWLNINVNKLIFLWVYDDIFANSIFEWIWAHFSPITYVYKLNKEEENNIKVDSQHEDFKFFDTGDKKLHEMVKIRIEDLRKLNIL